MNKSRVESEQDNLELLVSRNPQMRLRTSSGGLSGRLKWYSALLVLGLAGSAGCLWAMFYTAHSEEMAHKLGMTKVANSLESILDLLAFPVLMFTVILSVYAVERLYRIYQLANAPVGRRRRK